MITPLHPQVQAFLGVPGGTTIEQLSGRLLLQLHIAAEQAGNSDVAMCPEAARVGDRAAQRLAELYPEQWEAERVATYAVASHASDEDLLAAPDATWLIFMGHLHSEITD